MIQMKWLAREEMIFWKAFCALCLVRTRFKCCSKVLEQEGKTVKQTKTKMAVFAGRKWVLKRLMYGWFFGLIKRKPIDWTQQPRNEQYKQD